MVEILNKIQCELKAPKTQVNKFGGYHYRSCEDILEAVKPLLEKYEAVLNISDEIVLIGTRYYIKATATLRVKDASISTNAYARECESKKGMDEAQLTGATSSYARKYALNGLFAIDDEKDADTQDNREQPQAKSKANLQQKAMNAEQLADLSQLCELTKTNPQNIAKYYHVQELVLVPYDEAKSMLIKKFEKQQQELQPQPKDNQ